MKNSQKGSVATIVLVVIIAGLAGYLVWDKSGKQKISPDLPSFTTPPFVFPTPTLNSTPPTETVSGSEWSAYRDDKAGFEIKHPNFLNRDFDYAGEAEGRVFGVNGVGWGDDPYMYFSIYALPPRSTNGVSCWEGAQSGSLAHEISGNITISGQSYPKCLITNSWGTQSLHVSFNYQGKTWLFQASHYEREKDRAVADQMLSTFRFLK